MGTLNIAEKVLNSCLVLALGTGAVACGGDSVAPREVTGSTFARLVDVDSEERTIEVIYAEFFGRTRGAREARADGVLGPGEELPEPFYIRDLEGRDTLRLADDALVDIYGYDDSGTPKLERVSIEEFFEAAAPGRDPSDEWYGGVYYLWIGTAAGVVVALEQQYIP